MAMSMVVTDILAEYTRFMCPECFETFDITNEDKVTPKRMWAHDCSVDTSEWDDTAEKSA